MPHFAPKGYAYRCTLGGTILMHSTGGRTLKLSRKPTVVGGAESRQYETYPPVVEVTVDISGRYQVEDGSPGRWARTCILLQNVV